MLDKPGDAARLPCAAGGASAVTARSFYTACVLLGAGAGVHLAHVDTTTVVFRALTRG